jgi:hypothetical protein
MFPKVIIILIALHLLIPVYLADQRTSMLSHHLYSYRLVNSPLPDLSKDPFESLYVTSKIDSSSLKMIEWLDFKLASSKITNNLCWLYTENNDNVFLKIAFNGHWKTTTNSHIILIHQPKQI